MVTLEKLRSYLRIDSDYEDDLLNTFLFTARAYLNGAISDFTEKYTTYPEFASKADFLQMVIAAEFYQNRNNTDHVLSYTIRSLMAQLQYFATSDFTSDTTTSDTDLTFAMFDSAGNLVNSGIKLAKDSDFEEMINEVMGDKE